MTNNTNRFPIRMRAAAMTHAGKMRPHNEDCIAIAEWARAAPMTSAVTIECMVDEPRLCVVADGLGGHAGGEIASMLAVRDLIEATPVLVNEESIRATLSAVNKRLFDAVNSYPDSLGMGTTVVGLVAFQNNVTLFNIGDSRGYVRSGNYLRLLSIDDTTRHGCTDFRGRSGEQGHQITQSLGGTPSFRDVAPHVTTNPVQPGDRYLLCSDGLTDMLDQDTIERHLEDDAVMSIRSLIKAALAEGGHDNISVVIVDFLTASSVNLISAGED